MEEFDLYTRDRERTGKTVRRGDPVPEGLYRLVIHVCIFNSRGEMLIQKRRKEKDTWPGKWDLSCGGHVTAGEKSGEAAEREVWEELGVRLFLRESRPVLTVPFDEGFDDVYFAEKELIPSALTLQTEEVEKAGWASEEKILSMIASGEFIPYHPEVIRLLFAVRRRGGMHSAPEERRPAEPWTLRTAFPGDIPVISELYQEMLRAVFHRKDAEGYGEGDLDHYFAGGEDRITVAEVKGRTVGFLAAEIHREELSYLYIDDFAVNAAFRGRGIGTALLENAEAYGVSRGIRLFVLHAEEDNEKAIRLYEKHGYRVLDWNGSRLRMIKEL